jgi:hypothetical protein
MSKRPTYDVAKEYVSAGPLVGTMLVVVILIGVYLVGNLTGAAVSVLPNPTVTKTFGTPDLIVSDISWMYQPNQRGYTIGVTIKNQGTAKASNFEVTTKDTKNNVELLIPAANQNLVRCKLTVDKGKTGVCSYVDYNQPANTFPITIQATADSQQNVFGGGFWQGGVVRESNENNNVLSVKMAGCDWAMIGKCGNGICEKEKNPGAHGCPDRSETRDTCVDCIKCGDGICTSVEQLANGIVLENTVTKWACKADCSYIWGDGTCDKGEAGTLLGYLDCGVCGDGVCDRNEFNSTVSLKANAMCNSNPKICKVCAADC